MYLPLTYPLQKTPIKKKWAKKKKRKRGPKYRYIGMFHLTSTHMLYLAL